jgi:hypothetical protein
VTDSQSSGPPPVLREETARRRRRQEALDSLEHERKREAMLRDRLEPIIRDAEAWRADEAAVAGMGPEDVETLKRIGFVQQRPPEDAAERFEAQIAELEAMIEDSQNRQRAFAAYAAALDG